MATPPRKRAAKALQGFFHAPRAVRKAAGARVLTLQQRSDYQTSLSRSGFALALGGALIGLLVAGLVANGGHDSAAALLLAWAFGALAGMVGIATIAAPIWLVLHRRNRRGPVAAAMTGIGVALFFFIGGQTYGFGLIDPPPSDAQTLIYRWASAIATSLILSGIAALIALVMWRVAYQRKR